MFDRLLVDRRPVEGQRFRFILSLSSPTLTTFEKLVVDRLNFVLYYRPQVTRSVVIIPWGPTGVPVTGARCSDVATPCLKSRTSWMDHFSGSVGSTPSLLVPWVGSCIKTALKLRTEKVPERNSNPPSRSIAWFARHEFPRFENSQGLSLR